MNYSDLRYQFGLYQQGIINRRTLVWWIGKYQRANIGGHHA